MIASYRDLEVWQLAIAVVKDIYCLTKKFPAEEIYGLNSQMRRAAVSIASNIAEGKARQSKSEYVQFLYIALGSTAELETQVTIAKELDYLTLLEEKKLIDQLDHIGKMLRGLIKGLRTDK